MEYDLFNIETFFKIKREEIENTDFIPKLKSLQNELLKFNENNYNDYLIKMYKEAIK